MLGKECRLNGQGPVIVFNIRDLVIHQDRRPGSTLDGMGNDAREQSLEYRLFYGYADTARCDVPILHVAAGNVAACLSISLVQEDAALPFVGEFFRSYA